MQRPKPKKFDWGPGEADAILPKWKLKQSGLFEIPTKQADGYDKVVKAAGGDSTMYSSCYY